MKKLKYLLIIIGILGIVFYFVFAGFSSSAEYEYGPTQSEFYGMLSTTSGFISLFGIIGGIVISIIEKIKK